MNISIILPTFRPQAYLWDCLDSINAQTLDHTSFEVIIVLNGEREPYEQQIRGYLSQHPGFPCRLIYSEQRGVSAARNRGLDEAKGEYISFIDDDDLITPSYLEELFRIARPDTIPLSYITAFDDGTEVYRPLYITQHYRNQSGAIPYQQARRFFYVPYCKMLHRDIIGNRRFDVALRNGEDALFMFLVSDGFRWVRFTPRHAEYRYRQRPSSAFNAQRSPLYHISNALHCQWCASAIYFAHPLRYSIRFYLSYISATIMGCFRHLANKRQ